MCNKVIETKDNINMDPNINVIVEPLHNVETSSQIINEPNTAPIVINDSSPESNINNSPKNIVLLPNDPKTSQQPSETDSCINVRHLNDKQFELRALLSSWNLAGLYEYLNGQQIYLDKLINLTTEQNYRILKYADFKSHIIRNFDYKLKQWQQQIKFVESASTTSSSLLTIPSPPPPRTYETLSVLNILNNCMEGRIVLKLFDANKQIHDMQRNLMVDVILEHYNREKINLSPTICEHIAEQVVEIMPNEKKEYYYLKEEDDTPMGSIYYKYNNKQLRVRKTPHSSSSESSFLPYKKRFVLSANEAEHIEALKDGALNHEDFMMHWNGAFKARMIDILSTNSTAKITEKWPQYKTPRGHRLVNHDFSALFEDNQNIINDDFLQKFFTKIIQIYETQLKDEHCRTILYALTTSENITDDGKYAAAFYLLHGLLKANPLKRLTIQHCQDQFISLARSVAEFEEYLLRNKSILQPIIGIIGPDILHPEEIYVCFYSLKYKIVSVVKAIDIVYKIYHLFNLKYPDAGFAVWQFIQINFYDFKVFDEVLLPTVLLLKNQLLS